jgi:hypothetical protein
MGWNGPDRGLAKVPLYHPNGGFQRDAQVSVRLGVTCSVWRPI